MTESGSDDNRTPPTGARQVSPLVRLIEARRAGQEALAWQSLGFFFIAEGIIVTGAFAHHHRTAMYVLGGIGCVSSLIFLHMYVKARAFELVNSRWLRNAAGIDHRSIARAVSDAGFKKELWDRRPFVWYVRIPARHMWPAVLFASAVLWALYAFGVFG